MKLLVLCLLVATASAGLPNFIQTCSRSDPNIGKCFVEKANTAMKTLVDGNQELQFPALRPTLEHPGAKYQLGDEFIFQMKKTLVTGLDSIVLTDAKVNFEDRTIFFQFHFVQVDWVGQYVAKGLKNKEEITDKGHLVYHNNEYQMAMNYTLDNNHMAVKKISVIYLGTPNVEFNLANLDKHPELQSLMERSKAGFILSGTEALEQFVGAVFGGVFKVATFDEIFPPK